MEDENEIENEPKTWKRGKKHGSVTRPETLLKRWTGPGGFPEYAKKFLKIKPKNGGLIPFKLNEAQMIVYEKMMEQYKETGRIRAVILKGRQQRNIYADPGIFPIKVDK